ncbi:MAG: paaD [Frankiales bacterium]|nr:paaD [Frankiales bacterium]
MTTVREVLATVTDPELPVLTLEDLGVLREVSVDGDEVTVTVTPTYSGCPAMDEIRADITAALAQHGYRATVRTVLSPAWTTDWMSEDGKRKLREFGIAPPGPVLLQIGRRVSCPQCGSADTEEMARFSSTSCKAMWRCRSCREPFERFKEH